MTAEELERFAETGMIFTLGSRTPPPSEEPEAPELGDTAEGRNGRPGYVLVPTTPAEVAARSPRPLSHIPRTSLDDRSGRLSPRGGQPAEVSSRR